MVRARLAVTSRTGSVQTTWMAEGQGESWEQTLQNCFHLHIPEPPTPPVHEVQTLIKVKEICRLCTKFSFHIDAIPLFIWTLGSPQLHN